VGSKGSKEEKLMGRRRRRQRLREGRKRRGKGKIRWEKEKKPRTKELYVMGNNYI
jgi:hypothetical protein